MPSSSKFLYIYNSISHFFAFVYTFNLAKVQNTYYKIQFKFEYFGYGTTGYYAVVYRLLF